ncbi:hypothetical protein F2Q69_00013684 [Brassica cretica]|uniref:Uncharacterized protein n=1 Tax=Brassica cretica TaxID=69181 RepID=A0A8S9QZM8_BRACR|nr:hypothetical protein F2Q69_00013684 [Brassica cretica]
MFTLRAFTKSYIAVLPDSPLPGHPNQRSYISNQAANPFTPSASTSENDQQRQRDTTVQLIKFYEESHVPVPRVRVPASGSRVPAPRSGTFFRLPGQVSKPKGGEHVHLREKTSSSRAHEFDSRQGYISPREDLLLGEVYDRLIPVITTMKVTSYTLCSTPTTPHTGSGHDLHHTDRDTPCSSKHIEAPCSL